MLVGMTGPASHIVLIHGAATTAGVWDGVRRLLDELVPEARVETPQRAYTGDLAAEAAALTELCDGALVAGVSGGATLGLVLLAAGVRVRGAVLHEPAVGSLVPGLLAHVAQAYAAGGVPGFGAALYGPSWHPSLAPADPEAVARDFAMFRSFEPDLPGLRANPATARSLGTVGARSPQPRHDAARVLEDGAGLAREQIEGSGHAVHLDYPGRFAQLIARRWVTIP